MTKESGKYTAKNDYDVTINAVTSVLDKLEDFKNKLPNKTVFLGFDGYIDSLFSMVSSRIDSDNWKKMESMTEFGSRITDAAGSSCNIERVLKKKLAGGFAPNIARALSNIGSKVILAAAMGYPNIDPLFKEYSDRVQLISIKEMGLTAGFEFDDGKVMCTDFGNINQITWDTIMERIPRDEFIGLIEKSDGIGQGHWSLMPHMNNYWEHFIEDIYPNVSNIKNKIFLVDPADLKKRTNKDINKMLQLLQKIDEFLPVILSMNDRETIDVSNVLSSEDTLFNNNKIKSIKSKDDYVDFGKKLNEVLNISYVVTHDPHFATITTKDNHYWVTEGYTSKPRFTTAAGDHFNGGVLLGLLCDLKPEESIVVGNALTAIFVRTGVSTGPKEIKRFIDEYFNYVVNDVTEFEI